MWNSTPWGSPDEINCEMPALLESIAATYGIEFILIVLAYLAVTLLTTLIITQTSLALKNEVLGDEAHFDGISVYDKGSIWENLKAAFFFSPTEVALYEVVRHPHTEEEQEGNEGSVLEPEPDEGDGAAARPLPLSDDSLVEYVLSPGESAPHARRRIATEDSHAVLLEEEVEEEVPFSPTSLVVV